MLLTSYSASINAQVFETGNLVIPTTTTSGSTWTNGVYQDSLTCWSWGMPGYCGPNPIVRPDGNINYSFGLTDLYQSQSISNIFPNSGTKVLISGFNFTFTAKNGNGWDDGRVDQLSAYVQLYAKNKSILENYNYDLNYKFDWTTFSFNETFTKPYSIQNLSTFRYGFIGKDNNYWAGPYGPEINNISFSLRYSVDPCSVNQMSSPSCPGYSNALSKLTSLPAIPNPIPNNFSINLVEPKTSSSNKQLSSPNVTPSVKDQQPKIGEITFAFEQDKMSLVKNESTNQNQSSVKALKNLQSFFSLKNYPIKEQEKNDVLVENMERKESIKLFGNNFILESQKPISVSDTVLADNSVSVNRNTKENSLAAGITLDNMAKQPKGFESYMRQIKDTSASFYQTKDIYINQKTIDNARVLRGLQRGSERLHQEMIDTQYNKGD